MEFINRLWKESLIGEHPLETLKRLKGISQSQLNDLICSYAMRTVVFDFSNATEIRHTLRDELNSSYITRRLTVLNDISILNGRYIVPSHLAPQDYGYNIVRLYPDAGNENGQIDITFRKHDNSNAGGGGTRTAFVFVKADMSARYSEVFRNDFTATLNIDYGEEEIFMLVCGAPEVHHNYAWEPGFPKIYRFPWEIRIEGARPMGYTDVPNSEYKDVGGTYHPNGRGFVASTANVSPTAYVGTKAVVLDNAVVEGYARIEGAAVVKDNARVQDNSLISGFTIVGGNAVIKDNAKVLDFSRVNHGALIGGSATIKGSAAVF